MPHQITSFTARGVFGDRKYTIHFPNDESNASIIVGPNGTGKSTFINLYYFFISKQWGRLSALDFTQLELNLHDGDVIIINASDLVMSDEKLSLPSSLARYYERLKPSGVLLRYANKQRPSSADLRRISHDYNVPELAIRDLVSIARTEPNILHPRIAEIENKIDEVEFGTILYLPTFRRIERQMTFSNVDLDDAAQPREKLRFIELVKSGMQDVSTMIRDFIAEINSQSRRSVTRASQEFIREMVRGEINEFSIRNLKEQDSEELKYFIRSLDEELLTEIDKSKLFEFVEKEKRRQSGKPKVADQYMGYFVSKMVSVFARTQELESPLLEFLFIIDEYLAPDKYSSYDSSEVKIHTETAQIRLDDLSSGEKQIVAVFAYLLLSGTNNFTVIIDEPELSLSVPWQKRFLPDIINTRRCRQLIAVTHSPFIFDNSLEESVIDVQSLIDHV